MFIFSTSVGILAIFVIAAIIVVSTSEHSDISIIDRCLLSCLFLSIKSLILLRCTAATSEISAKPDTMTRLPALLIFSSRLFFLFTRFCTLFTMFILISFKSEIFEYLDNELLDSYLLFNNLLVLPNLLANTSLIGSSLNLSISPNAPSCSSHLFMLSINFLRDSILSSILI